MGPIVSRRARNGQVPDKRDAGFHTDPAECQLWLRYKSERRLGPDQAGSRDGNRDIGILGDDPSTWRIPNSWNRERFSVREEDGEGVAPAYRSGVQKDRRLSRTDGDQDRHDLDEAAAAIADAKEAGRQSERPGSLRRSSARTVQKIRDVRGQFGEI